MFAVCPAVDASVAWHDDDDDDDDVMAGACVGAACSGIEVVDVVVWWAAHGDMYLDEPSPTPPYPAPTVLADSPPPL